MAATSGPVTQLLEQQLRAKLAEKQLVVWLDPEHAFTGFVDAFRQRPAAERWSVPIVPFRGSFLELMLALEHEAGTQDKPLLLVHLPGYNNLGSSQSPLSVRHTPLLELAEAGTTFHQKLATLVREAANGRVPLPEVEAFLQRPGLSLDAADDWLREATQAGSGTGSGPDVGWISQLTAAGLLNHLIDAPQEAQSPVREALLRRAESLFGMDAGWLASLEDLTARLVSWVLCVEFVHDLRCPPRTKALLPLQALPSPTVKRCQDEASRLRQQHSERYTAWALDVESWLTQDKAETRARDLGRIDTFHFEALAIYQAAVEALSEGDYAQALAWFDAHEDSQGFWVRQDPSRKWAWSLVGDAARLGVALAGAPRPLQGVRSLEEAVLRYAEQGAPVDLSHRRFEQRHAALDASLLHELTQLSAGIDRLRASHATWADELSRDFAALCREHGALPPPELQQRTLFDQAILPALEGSGPKVALFLLDALRYEMALELRESLAGAGVELDLRARLAELPTITAVGMNALAPIERGGQLAPLVEDGRFKGFRAGEAQVTRPKDRLRAITARVGGKPPLALDLQEVLQRPAAELKNRVAQAQLVLVHGLDLDIAGESGLGVRVFSDILKDVLAARHLLEKAGVHHFVFTADHGFLLQRGGRPAQGVWARADRRYVLSDTERPETGHLCVSLQALGYDARGYLILREDTAEFDTGRGPGAFTHGGNSLQERVIPVLHAKRRRAAAEAGVPLVIECEPLPPMDFRPDVQRLRLRVAPARSPGQARLDFAYSQSVEVLLRVPERDDIDLLVKTVTGKDASSEPRAVRVRPATSDWVDVYFSLQGATRERVPVQLSLAHAPGVTASPPTTYPVVDSRGATQPQRSATGEPRAAVPYGAEAGLSEMNPTQPPGPNVVAPARWGERLGDPDAGKVFDFLEEHRAVNEEDLIELLGSPRKARAFAARFDSFRDKLTFEVEVAVTASGKRYQRV